ncbi:GldG family protein, partial [Alphaproteobacteria bacterium]|nr:GldG family protein [Alphaproteobacteria bacterium]
MNKLFKNDIVLNNFKFLKFIIFTLLFLFFNVILSGILVNTKLDLTADRLFTVSSNTKEIIKELNEPIKIQLFFSNALSKELAQIRDYEKRVRELLYNYVNIANGNISLEIIDPKPFTDQEDLANVYGVQGLQINEEGERFYFGAVVSNSVDDTTVIPFFDLGRERFLEYDLTKTIYNLANTKKPTIGLISGLPFIGGVTNSQEGPQYQEPFYLHTRILEFFKVQDLTQSITNIPNDIDQLLVIHPKDLSDETLYAIDQFVMSGKGVIFFVDPFSEHERNKVPDSEKNTKIPASNLDKLFTTWGFQVSPGMIVGDVVNGRKVSLGRENNQKIVTYILWLALQENTLSRQDIVTANLDYIFVKSAGALENLNTNKNLRIEPLIKTSKNAMLVERYKMQFRADPEELLKNFESQEKSYMVGARIKGTLYSAYSKEDSENFLKAGDIQYKNIINNANILVFTDTDLLTDTTWVSKQDMFGRNNITPMADNGRLVINALESMSGGANLIGLRGRGVSNRPFLVVESIQKNAELSYREKELSLQNQLEDTEKKLQAIQNSDVASESNTTSQQSDTIEEFKNKIYQIRKDLRDVQRQLNVDIDNL